MPTQAKKDGNARHIAKLDIIKVQPYREEGAAIRAAAAAAGKSVQGYVLEAVREKMERERAGGVPAGAADAPAGSPEGIGTQEAGVMVFSGGVPEDNSSSRLSSLTRPDSQTGLEPEPAPRGTSVFDFVKQISGMSREEVDKMLGCDPESVESYREQMERKRQRLAELNTKAGGLSRAEAAERQRLIVECKDYPQDDDSAQ